jgi:hypothetical protein
LTTLALICEEYVGDVVIDFLKIDVEGFEAAVIAGGDWERWQPRVIVVEATEPNERTPSHDAWEPALISAGYVFALFDGLNRFYAHRSEPELLRELAYPACVFDDYVEAARVEERDALAFERDEALRQLSERSAEVAQWQSQARHSERAARLMEDRVHLAEDEALRAELGAAALRNRLAAESAAASVRDREAAESAAASFRDRLAAESAARLTAEELAVSELAAREAVARELDALRATRTLRFFAPLHAVYGVLRRMSVNRP